MERSNCANCKHRRDVLVPCEWLGQQVKLVLNCPYFEPMKEEKVDG